MPINEKINYTNTLIMKQIALIVFMLTLVSTGYSQQETLLSNARVVGGFGGPLLEFGKIRGEMTTSVGGGGGVVIDNFFVGAYGIGSVSNLRYQIENDDFYMDLAHGGFWLGYTPMTNKIVHPWISTRFGWGFADIDDDPFEYPSAGDAVFVFTPEVGAELNVARFLRISGSIGYRMVNDIDQLDNLTNKDFRSVTGQLTFRFGWFGPGQNNNQID